MIVFDGSYQSHSSISQDCLRYLGSFCRWKSSGPGCSKLMMSLVKVSLKFQTLISEICQYFLLKKCEKLLSFFQQNISVYLVIKS